MILVQGKGLSGSALKVIALVSMTLDHIAYYLMDNSIAYDVMRTVGRMAFPIFAFLLVEGYAHTRSETSAKLIVQSLLISSYFCTFIV